MYTRRNKIKRFCLCESTSKLSFNYHPCPPRCESDEFLHRNLKLEHQIPVVSCAEIEVKFTQDVTMECNMITVEPRGGTDSPISIASSTSSGKIDFKLGCTERLRLSVCRIFSGCFHKRPFRTRLLERGASLGTCQSVITNPSLSIIIEQSEESLISKSNSHCATQSEEKILNNMHDEKSKARRILVKSREGEADDYSPSTTPSPSTSGDIVKNHTNKTLQTPEDSDTSFSDVDSLIDIEQSDDDATDSAPLTTNTSAPEITLQAKKSEFDEFAPQFCTLAEESVSDEPKHYELGALKACHDDPKIDTHTMQTAKCKKMAPEISSKNAYTCNTYSNNTHCEDSPKVGLEKKRSKFEEFAPLFSTMEMELMGEDSKNDTCITADSSPTHSIEDLNSDIPLENKKSTFEQFAPLFSTMEMESCSNENMSQSGLVKPIEMVELVGSSRVMRHTIAAPFSINL